MKAATAACTVGAGSTPEVDARYWRHGRQDTRARHQGRCGKAHDGLFFAEWKAPTVTRGSRGLRQAFPNPERYEAGPERLNFDSTRSDKGLVRRACGTRNHRHFFLRPCPQLDGQIQSADLSFHCSIRAPNFLRSLEAVLARGTHFQPYTAHRN
jgi:hypothetical protein